MKRRGGATLRTLFLVAAATSLGVYAGQDDLPLGLSDLAAEHDALAGKTGGSSPPLPVTFRDLWDRPEDYQDVRVAVSGRVVRTFRQDAVGSFPPLVEAWIEEPPGNLFCIVFPSSDRAEEVVNGAGVVFHGVYLRRIRYQADGDRLAPLLVGSDAPTIAEPAPRVDPVEPKVSPDSDWPGPLATLGLFVGLAIIGGILAWRSLTTPVAGPRRRGRGDPPRPEAASTPALEFLEPEADDVDR